MAKNKKSSDQHTSDELNKDIPTNDQEHDALKAEVGEDVAGELEASDDLQDITKDLSSDDKDEEGVEDGEGVEDDTEYDDDDDDDSDDDFDDDSAGSDSDDSDSDSHGYSDDDSTPENLDSFINFTNSNMGSDVEFSTFLHPEVERQKRKSRRTRRLFIAIAILLVLIIIGVAAYSVLLAQNASQSGQETLESDSSDVDTLGSESGTEVATEDVVEDVVVPDLTKLFGVSSAEALKLLPQGTIVSAIDNLEDPANPVKSEQTIKVGVAKDGKTEGPMKVFLGMDSNDIVIKAGFVTTIESLGYGLLSFADVINNEHIINATFEKAGIILAEPVELSSSATDYATFDDKGNLMTEKGAFEGACDVAGVTHPWYATVVYDYKLYNATGKISKTQRDIYIYVEPNAASIQENELLQEQLAEAEASNAE